MINLFKILYIMLKFRMKYKPAKQCLDFFNQLK
jgi:hypothetical protein